MKRDCFSFLASLYQGRGALETVVIKTVDYAYNTEKTLHRFPIVTHDDREVHDIAYNLAGDLARLANVSNAHYEVEV